MYYKQLINQFWVPEKFKVSRDLRSWDDLTDLEQQVYTEVLSGLTGLDYHQGSNGMPLIAAHHDDKFEQAVFQNIIFMESIHAKSYSYIFESLISQKKSEYYLSHWVEEQPQLQIKYDLISHYYNNLFNPLDKVTLYDRYMAMVASVFLETFSFYSGFFYPVFLSGQGKMVASGEIIHKIIEDESIHGSFTGFVAQRLYNDLPLEEQNKADNERETLLEALMKNEDKYTDIIYSKINLVKPVKDYLRYNANRALQNLGFDEKYDHDPINAIVLNGINKSTINHDFFSTTGDYAIPLNIETIQDNDFDFSKKGNDLDDDD